MSNYLATLKNAEVFLWASGFEFDDDYTFDLKAETKDEKWFLGYIKKRISF